MPLADVKPFVLLLATAAALPSQTPLPADAVQSQGKHFVVHLHPGELPEPLAARLAESALAAAERAWALAAKALSVRASPPLTLHVYAARDGYRAVEQRLGPQARFRLDEFLDPASGDGHLPLRPDLDAAMLERLGLPQTTEQAVVRLAIAQLVRQQLPADSADPFLEQVVGMGLAEQLTNPARRCGVDAEFDTRRAYDWEDRRAGTSIGLRDLIQCQGDDSRASWDRARDYRAVLAQFLASVDSGWARKLVAAARRRQPGADVDARLAAVAGLLGDDWLRSQQRFTRFRSELQPAWRQDAPMLDMRQPRWLLVGGLGPAAIAAVAPPPAGDYEISGSFVLEPFDGSELRVQLDWNGDNLIGALFDHEGVRLMHWDNRAGKWSALRSHDIAIASGRPRSFGVTVTADEVRVELDGTVLFGWPSEGRGMHGSWGLAGNGVVGLERLRIEPAAHRGR